MRNYLYALILILISISCQKEDIQSLSLNIDNVDVAPFFVTRQINTNKFSVYKGVHMEGDDIPWMDIVLSVEISKEQLNNTFDFTTNDQWQVFVAKEMTLYRIFPYDLEENKPSTCRVKYLGGNQFDIDLYMHIKPESFRPKVINFSYTGDVILIDSDGKII